MPRLYDLSTGTPLDVASPEEASSLISDGKFGLPGGTRQAIQLPDGTIGQIDAEHVADAVKGGAKFIGDDGLADYQAKQKYGTGLGNEVIAGAEGAARVASLGTSDMALKPFVGSEHLKREAELNPTGRIAGEVAGAVAPMFVGDEAGAGGALKTAAEAAEEAPAAAEAAPELAQTIASKGKTHVAKGQVSVAQGKTMVPASSTEPPASYFDVDGDPVVDPVATGPSRKTAVPQPAWESPSVPSGTDTYIPRGEVMPRGVNQTLVPVADTIVGRGAVTEVPRGTGAVTRGPTPSPADPGVYLDVPSDPASISSNRTVIPAGTEVGGQISYRPSTVPSGQSLIAEPELSPSLIREEMPTNPGKPAPVEPEATPEVAPQAPAAAPAAQAPPIEPGIAQQALRAFAAPQRAVADLGEAAGESAAAHLADLGLSPTWQRIGSSIARGAVEAPIYQVGSNISDDVFDDHDLTAQSLLAGTGTAALFGAGLGGSLEGALSVASKYAPPALDRFAKWADRQQERLRLPNSTYKSDLDAALRATARMSDNLDELEKHWNNELKPALVSEAIGTENKRQAVSQGLLYDVGRSLETATFNTALKGRVEKLKDVLARDLLAAKNDGERFMAFEDFKKGSDAFLKTTKAALGGDDIQLRHGVSEAVGMVRKSLADAEQWGRAGHIQAEFNARYSPYINARDSAKRLFFEKGGLLEGESKQVPRAATVGNFIDRRAGDNYEKYKRAQEILDNYHQRARDLAEVYGGYAEAGIGGQHVNVEKLAQHIDEMHGTFEKAVASRKADLQGLTNAKTTPHLGWHHVPGVAGVLNASTRMLTDNPAAMMGLGALHFAGAPTAALAAGAAGLAALKLIRGGKSEFIANIAKAGAESARSVSTKLDAFLDGGTVKAPGNAGAIKSFTLGDEKPKRGESADDAFNRVARELSHVTTAGQQGVDVAGARVAQATPEMGRFAPNVQRALAAATGRTAAYLASVTPKSHVEPTGLGDEPYTPSDSERSNFERQIRTATQPMSILDDLGAGTITPDQVTALNAIHPSWMTAARGQLAQKLASRGPGLRLPYAKKVSLSIFMGGAPTHDSLRPDSMALIQQAYAPQQPKGPSGGNSRTARPAAVGKLNFAAQASTKFSGGGGL